MAENSGTPFLLWGYVTVIISLLVWFLLKETGNNNWQFLWFLLPVIAFPATLWSQRKARKMLKTYIDRVVDYVWTVFGLGAFLVSCTAIFVWKIPILFVILLMMGMGTALTGLIVNTKVVTIGGVLGALLSLGCFYMPGIDPVSYTHLDVYKRQVATPMPLSAPKVVPLAFSHSPSISVSIGSVRKSCFTSLFFSHTMSMCD